MPKKYLRILLFTFLIYACFISSNNTVYALGDYQYLWMSKKIPIINNINLNGNIQIGCEAYCFWDRVISIDNKTAYAMVLNGNFEIVQSGQELHVSKIDDHKINMYGTVTLKTIQKYTAQEATKAGLVSSGFIKNGNHEIPNYYYKTIRINQDIFL